MSLNKTKYKVCAALGENLWSSSKIGRFRKKKWSRVQGQGLKVHYPQTSKTQVHLQPSVYLYGNRLKAKQKLRKFYGNALIERHDLRGGLRRAIASKTFVLQLMGVCHQQ